MQYKVRFGYVLFGKTRGQIFKAGDIVDDGNVPLLGQMHKVEPVQRIEVAEQKKTNAGKSETVAPIGETKKASDETKQPAGVTGAVEGQKSGGNGDATDGLP